STLQLSEGHMSIADRILEEIRTRLQFLDEVGLDYLTLDRLTSTLSGGESQRIQLATSLGSHLVGALYVLDEPSIGLHPRDTQRLIDILKSLRDLGNTVLVVEHDPETIQAADHVIDLGPGAGELGGKLLFAGPYAALLEEPKSLTGRYLNGELRIPVPNKRHKPAGKFLRLFDAIREVFAETPDAKRRGYAAGHFSFNVPGGRCETCQGDGTVTVEMQFLADVELICEECRGTRFKSGVLEVHYHGKNIHEVLQLTVREALAFFVNVPKIVSKLRILNEIGLGYLRLGQSATTLS